MSWAGTAVWALVFLVLPVALGAAALTVWAGDLLLVFAALAWLVLGTILYPFTHLAR